MMPNRIPQAAFVNLWREFHAAGKTRHDLAERIGVTPTAVYRRWLRMWDAGVELEPLPLRPRDRYAKARRVP